MENKQISSVLRALKILECFMNSKTEWTLKALVDYLDMPKTTVFRQVSTMVERQYLMQDPVRKSYHVGPRLILMASAIIGQSDLRKLARPELEKLSNNIKETINLSVLLEDKIFYLDKVETHRSIVCNTHIGEQAPAYATSSGKIMLIDKDNEYIDKCCQQMIAAEPFTENTIVDPEVLRKQLAEARINGFAMDNGEIEQGLICIAAPIYDMMGHITAAVSISGPAYRMKHDQKEMIREVKKTAENISRLLGYSQ